MPQMCNSFLALFPVFLHCLVPINHLKTEAVAVVLRCARSASPAGKAAAAGASPPSFPLSPRCHRLFLVRKPSCCTDTYLPCYVQMRATTEEGREHRYQRNNTTQWFVQWKYQSVADCRTRPAWRSSLLLRRGCTLPSACARMQTHFSSATAHYPPPLAYSADYNEL